MAIHEAPEIYRDIFANKIEEALKKEKCKIVVDIGAAQGLGSTWHIVNALKNVENHKVYALEAYKDSYEILVENYKELDWVIPVWAQSSKLSDYCTQEELYYFIDNNFGSLNRMPKETIWQIVYNEYNYLKENNVPEDGIDLILKYIGGLPDAVILDGSSYTHTDTVEFPKFYGTKVIILDDTTCMKNMFIYRRLKSDSDYYTFYDDISYRFGVAIFIKNKEENI